MKRVQAFCQLFGLHPLVAFGTIAIDWMLFGDEVATAGIGWLISLPVGAALAIAAILIQRYQYRDSIGVAVGKGLMLGLLTAIPTALPTLAVLPFAALGMARSRNEQNLPARLGPPTDQAIE